jgi:hypothetical protein
VNSARRYEYQFSTLLPGLDADVLSLNEVTEHYLGRLLELDWVRSKYYVTRFSSKTSFSYNDKNKYFFVVLLSKYSFHAVYNFSFDRSIPSRPGSVVAGVLQLPHGRFLTICTALALWLIPSSHATSKKSKWIEETSFFFLLMRLRSHEYICLSS